MSGQRVGSFLGWCTHEVGDALRHARGRSMLDRADLFEALLADGGGTASEVVHRLGIDRDELLGALEPLSCKRTGPMTIGHHVMATVDFAAMEAARVGQKEITGGHLLAALAWGLRAGHWFLREPPLTAWRVLAGWRDGSLTLWDLEHRRGPLRLEVGAPVECVAAAANWQQVACGCADGSLHVFDLQADFHAPFERLLDGVVNAVAWNPAAPQLLSGGDDGIARLWRTDNGELQHELIGHDGPVRSVTFDPDGEQAYTGGADTRIRVWDAKTGALCDTYEGHSAPVRRVAFLQPDEPVVSSAEDDEAIVWRVPPEHHRIRSDPLEPVFGRFGISAEAVRAAL